RYVQIRCDAESVYFVMCACLGGCDRWSSLVSELPLVIAHHAELQAPVAAERDRVCRRIVEIQRLAWMNLSTLLCRVHFIHLKSRDSSCSVLCQIEGLAGRESMSPIARADVVI